jgi:hypothetical protein
MRKHLRRFGNLFVIGLLRSPLHHLASSSLLLSGGAEVEVRLRGRRLQGQAEIAEDSAAVETYLDRYPGARKAIEAADSPTFVRVAALTPNS